jgi:hypothetical protein
MQVVLGGCVGQFLKILKLLVGSFSARALAAAIAQTAKTATRQSPSILTCLILSITPFSPLVF